MGQRATSRCTAGERVFESRNITTVFQSPYSPDLNLCDRFLFTWMKNDFSGRQFDNHEKVQEAALHWARQLSEEDLQHEVQRLVDHCQAVIDAEGDYVTK